VAVETAAAARGSSGARWRLADLPAYYRRVAASGASESVTPRTGTESNLARSRRNVHRSIRRAVGVVEAVAAGALQPAARAFVLIADGGLE